jgi:aminoglycoside phosphotransferase (APT) family kinase protein
VFPIAGTSARSGFKFRPFLELGGETFIEAAARPFRKWSHVIARLVFVCLEEHERAHAVRARLGAMFADRRHDVVVLAKHTAGPAETVVRAIEAANITGRMIVCDCDHSVDVDPLFRAIGDDAADCILPTWSLRDEDLRAWSVAAVADRRVNGIAEKRLPEGNGEFVGVIGCAYLADAQRIIQLFHAGAAGYVSDLVQRLIAGGDRVLAVPIDKAEFFGDPRKLRSVRAKHNVLLGSIFCDLDGVLVEHEDTADYTRPLRPLPGSLERLRDWKTEGYFIVLTTARVAANEPALRAALDAAGVPYHHLITGLPSGPRFLINDRKPSALLVSQAQALEVERNQGIAHLSISQSYPSVRRRFKGGSFADTLLVEDDEKLFVRKRVSKRENLTLGYAKLKNQYRTLERFSRMSESLVAGLYGEHDNTIEYYYDMEYLPGHRLLSECGNGERGAALTSLLGVLGERVYAGGSRLGRSGSDWLEAHLASKIYARVDAVLGHPRLAPLVTAREIVIDQVVYPGLRELLARVSDPRTIGKLAPNSFCTVHGDLTFENVLYAGGDVRLIDMDGADFVDAPELDLGKLFQSIVARYEDWAHSDRALFGSVRGSELACHYQAEAPDAELLAICEQAWSQILAASVDQVRVKGWFYMGLHLLRMVPFRLKVSEEQALYALANGVRWISRAVAEC